MDRAMRRHALWVARAMARSDLTPLTAEDVAALERLCRARTLAPGTRLIAAGADVDRVWVVRSGAVALTTRRALAGRQVVGLVREGGVVGDLPLFCEEQMPFDAHADAPTTVLELDAARLVEVLRRSPSLSMRWTTSIAQRLEQTQRRLIALLTRDLTGQVIALLLEERERDGDRSVVRLPHGTIAELLGARRQSVSRVLAALRRDGLVENGYRVTVLRNPEALAARIGESLDRVACAADHTGLRPGSWTPAVERAAARTGPAASTIVSSPPTTV